MKSYKKPTPDQIARAEAKLVTAEHVRLFLEHLENPYWLEPLYKMGLFASPPQPIYNESEGTISYRSWAAISYFKVIASANDANVSALLAEILCCLASEDPFIRADVAHIAVKLPVNLAAKVVESQIPWIKSQRKLDYCVEPYGELIRHLLAGGEHKAARQLFWTLAGFYEELIPNDQKSAEYRRSEESGVRIDSFDHARLFELVAPGLAAVNPLLFLKELSGELRRILSWLHGKDTVYDWSKIWRKDVGVDEGHPRSDIQHTLVSWTRETMKSTAVSEESLFTAIKVLHVSERPILKRLALHALGSCEFGSKSLLQKLITLDQLFDDDDIEAEAWYATAQLWSKLGTLRSEILRTIEAGPELNAYKEAVTANIGKQPSDLEVQTFIDNWRSRFLNHIWEQLSADELRPFESLRTKLEQYRQYRLDEPEGVFTPRSPVTAASLAALDDSSVIAFLKEWKPTASEYWIDRDALAATWSEVIETEPTRFARITTWMESLPEYLRWRTIYGFSNSLKATRELDIRSVLLLVLHYLEQARPGDDGELLRAALSLCESAIDTQLLTDEALCLVWDVIHVGLQSAWSPEVEAQSGWVDRDWFSVAINSPKPKAVLLAIRLLVWMHFHGNEGESKSEVWKACEEAVWKHLDAKVERSRSVRAVYGQAFPWLATVYADKSQIIRDATFSLEDQDTEQMRAAWESYLLYSRFFDETFVLLRPVYVYVVSQDTLSDDSDESTSFNVAWHAVIAYLRGLERYEAGSVVFEVINRSSPKVLQNVVRKLGHDLSSRKEGNKQVDARFAKLWEIVLSAIQSRMDEDYKEVASSFDTWLETDLDTAWLMTNLEAAVKLCPRMKGSPEVLEWLAKRASSEPARVARVTLSIVQNPSDRWIRSMWDEPLRDILKTLCAADDTEAVRLAREIQEHMIREGFAAFRKL